MRTGTKQRGFTLIEMLTVIAIIALLAAILVPVAGHAKSSALKRRAMLEMNSIKVAVMQFYADHNFMPWGDPEDPNLVRVGPDAWTKNNAEQKNIMRWLTGENPLKKVYLQLPEKSHAEEDPLIFVDPWKQNYRIGLDRDLDGAMLPNDPDGLYGGENYVRERVLVYSLGDPADEPRKPMQTFDYIPNP